MYWTGLVHDLSKFLPDEFIPYARHFYGKGKKGITEGRDKTGYYKPTDTGDLAFEKAWFLHQKRNDHHWQWHVVPDRKEVKVETDDIVETQIVDHNKAMEMPERCVRELLADWRGAGAAQGSPHKDGGMAWFMANRLRMELHPKTEKQIIMMLELFNGR